MECSHGAEDEYEEHGAQNEGGHAHGLADFAIREQQRLPVTARFFIAILDVVIHVDGVIDSDAQDHRHNEHRYHVERHIQ